MHIPSRYGTRAGNLAGGLYGVAIGKAFFTESMFIHAKDQEPIELLLGLAFLLFVVVNKFRYRRGGPATRLTLRRAV